LGGTLLKGTTLVLGTGDSHQTDLLKLAGQVKEEILVTFLGATTITVIVLIKLRFFNINVY
jgi:hypothetical protein